MNLKKEVQDINNKLEQSRRKLTAAIQRGDDPIIDQFNKQIAALEKQLASVKGQQKKVNGKKSEAIRNLAFNRPLTKKEQADMGKLKKSVRGLVVVHPMTALGREMGVDKVTGFAPKEF